MFERYIVDEIQVYADGTMGTLQYTFDNRAQAESKYHGVLSFAAVSTCPVHTAIMFTSSGVLIATQTYYHDIPVLETPAESETLTEPENNDDLNDENNDDILNDGE